MDKLRAIIVTLVGAAALTYGPLQLIEAGGSSAETGRTLVSNVDELSSDLNAFASTLSCTRWDMNGEWVFVQTNDTSPSFRLQQTGNGLQGTGHYGYLTEDDCVFFVKCGRDAVFVDASVDGTINGDSIELTAYWNNGTIGSYSGRIGAQGRIEGSTYDKQHPQTMAHWYSDRTAKCLAGSAASDGGIGNTSSALSTNNGVSSLRRVRTSGSSASPPRPICDVARDARARNSPAAPGLEAQCLAQLNSLAARGTVLANEDPAALQLRIQQPDTSAKRGFDIGMAAAEGQTLPGPGKQKIHDTLPVAEQKGFTAAVTFSLARNRKKITDLAPRGAVLANQDPLAEALRNQQPDESARLGFDIGMAAAEGHTAPGPGKQRIRDSLYPAEQKGFISAVAFTLDRNRNAELAAVGSAIAQRDPTVGAARNTQADAFYRLGFDIATGIFGDPALGAHGNTATGPGSLGIRDGLNTAGQKGFNAAVTFHLSRKYR